MLNQLGSDNLNLIFMTFLELLLLIIPIIIMDLIDKKPLIDHLKSIGFDFSRFSYKKSFLCIYEGIGVAILFFLIAGFLTDVSYTLISSIFGDAFIQDAVSNLIDVSPNEPSPLELIIIISLQFLIVAPCEEAFFRGFIFKKLHYKLNYIFSVVLSSTIFAFYHLPPFIVPYSTIFLYFWYFFTFGILLTLLYSLNRELLLPCILTHAIFNMIVLIT